MIKSGLWIIWFGITQVVRGFMPIKRQELPPDPKQAEEFLLGLRWLIKRTEGSAMEDFVKYIQRHRNTLAHLLVQTVRLDRAQRLDKHGYDGDDDNAEHLRSRIDKNWHELTENEQEIARWFSALLKRYRPVGWV